MGMLDVRVRRAGWCVFGAEKLRLGRALYEMVALREGHVGRQQERGALLGVVELELGGRGSAPGEAR